MPRSILRGAQKKKSKYNGYGETNLPMHVKDLKAAQTAAAEGPPSYNVTVLAVHTKNAFLPAYGEDLAAATKGDEKEKAEVEVARVGQEAIDQSVLADQLAWKAFENMCTLLRAEIDRMDAQAAIRAAEKLVVTDGVTYVKAWE